MRLERKVLRHPWQWWVKNFLPLLIGLAILFYLYRHLELTNTLRLLRHGVRYEYLLLSLPMGLLGNALRGYRWGRLMHPLYTPGARPINPILITVGSYAVSLAIPRAGEVWRCTEMKQREDYAFSATVGTLLIDRLSDMCVVLVLLVIVMLSSSETLVHILADQGVTLDSGLSHLFSLDYAAAWSIAVGVLIVIGLVFYRMRERTFMMRLQGKVRAILRAASTLRGWRAWVEFLLLTMLLWGAYYYHFYIAFWAFDFTAHLSHKVIFTSFVLSTLMVAIPTPAGVGPWHYAVIISLSAFGVTAADAGNFALIVHTVQTLWTIVVGIIAIFVLPIVNRHYKRVPSSQEGVQTIKRKSYDEQS